MNEKIKTVKLGKVIFLQGMKECPACEYQFNWTLPPEVYRFWEGYCPECSLAPIMDLLNAQLGEGDPWE